MFYRPEARPAVLKHDPFKALVSPRPIAWVSSMDGEGRVNLAPYSFFNAVGDRPPLLMIAPNGHKAEEPVGKDTLRNVLETEEFVVNVTPARLAEAMNVTAAPYGVGEDEFVAAGLEKAPCEIVRPPRIASAPAAFECRLIRHVALPASERTQRVDALFGEVVGVHIDDAVIDGDRVDVTRYRPLARLGYMNYATVDAVFDMPRPRKAE